MLQICLKNQLSVVRMRNTFFTHRNNDLKKHFFVARTRHTLHTVIITCNPNT